MRVLVHRILLAMVVWWCACLPPAAAQTSAGDAAAAPAPAVVAPLRPGIVPQEAVSAADTAWMMTSTALVLLMTLPGVALFYAGMVRRKNVLNTMACVVAIAALVSLLWFAVGYSWAFTPGSQWLGSGARMWFTGLDYD